MDFSLDDDQLALREAVRRFAERAAPAHERAHAPRASQALAWRQGMAELGLYGLCVDADHGGLGLGAVEAMLVAQALGEALVDGAWLATAMASAPLLARCSTPALRERWLPSLLQGEAVAALAWLEPGARFDTRRVATRARRLAAGGQPGWQLQGVKSHVLSGDEADLFLVSARTDDDPDASAHTDVRAGAEASAGRGEGGLTLFAVPADSPGLRRQGHATVDGRGAATIHLEAVWVAEDAVLGGVGAASPLLAEALRRAGAAHAAEAAGTLDALVEMTAEHLRTRQQFGKPLATLQVVQHRVADMAIIREQVLSMACVAAMAAGAPAVEVDPWDSAVKADRLHAAAMVTVAQGSRRVALDAIQLHGAMGVTDECTASRCARRLLGAGLWWGDDAHHLAHMARTARTARTARAARTVGPTASASHGPS